MRLTRHLIDGGLRRRPRQSRDLASFDRHFQGGFSGASNPGLKPWAESSSPFGANDARRNSLKNNVLRLS
jgi:hypothetical protein